MDKIPLLAAVLLPALLAAPTGYLIGSRHQGHLTISRQEDHKSISQRPPRFTLNSQENLSSSETGNTTRSPGNRSLDDLLACYSRMTPEQLEQEINRWQNNALYFSPNEKENIALAYLGHRWGQTDPEQALQRLNTLGHLTPLLSPAIIQSCAAVAPETTAAYIIEHYKELPNANDLLPVVARELGDASPDTALKWAEGFDKKTRGRILPSLMNGLARAHPEQIKNCLERLSAEDLSSHYLCSSIAGQWAAYDWDAASSWINTLGKGEKGHALFAALEKLGETNPEKALNEAKKIDRRSTEGILRSITQGMAQKDPIRAIQWLTENAPEDLAEKNAGLILGRLMNHGTPEVTKYITGMQNGSIKDSLLTNLVDMKTYNLGEAVENFEETLSLANSITNQEKREKSLQKSFELWQIKDRKQATDWLKRAPLPDNVKRKLQKK